MAKLKPIDVFLDIENLAIRLADPVVFYETMEGLKKLPANLAKRGYRMRFGWIASAFFSRRPEYRERVARLWASVGFQTEWTKKPSDIADTVLLARMHEIIKQNALAPHVLLITGDGDFAEILLSENRKRYFIVLGRAGQTSAALSFLAHETWEMQDLLE